MMKVYEVHYDNGEAYDDAFYCSEAFFASQEAAEKYLKEQGCHEREGVWYPEKYVCAVKGGKCEWEDCEYYYDSDCFDEDKFVEQFGEHCEYCPEIDKVMDSAMDNSFYRILEHEVYL